MKIQSTLLAVVFIMGINFNLYAQSDSTIINSSVQQQMIEVDTISANSKLAEINQPRNIIKINLAPLLFKSISVQYERVLNRKISIAIQYRTMPNTGIPFKHIVLKYVGNDDPDIQKIIDNFKMSNYAITPEVRLYLSRKGYGRGFYLAPFYRYASFTVQQFNVTYTGDNDDDQIIKLSGNLTSNTYGLAIGAQNALGKHFVLDWSLFGPHYGSAKGNFSGNSSKPLTAADQDDIRTQLEDIDIPFINKTVNVDANGASVKLDGPWAGLRLTIGLGFRF